LCVQRLWLPKTPNQKLDVISAHGRYTNKNNNPFIDTQQLTDSLTGLFILIGLPHYYPRLLNDHLPPPIVWVAALEEFYKQHPELISKEMEPLDDQLKRIIEREHVAPTQLPLSAMTATQRHAQRKRIVECTASTPIMPHTSAFIVL
jgi:hypothetical protein